MIGDLARLSDEQLSTMLPNCVLRIDDPESRDEAKSRIRAIQAEMAKRAKADEAGSIPMLACCGYNVRQRGWRMQQRQRLLRHMVEQELPDIDGPESASAWGEPNSRERIVALRSMISKYDLRWGGGPNMEQARSRWRADLAFLNELDRAR